MSRPNSIPTNSPACSTSPSVSRRSSRRCDVASRRSATPELLRAEGLTENPNMPPARKRSTVLVVEDDPALRADYRSVLTLEGYAVVTAEDGLDALARV